MSMGKCDFMVDNVSYHGTHLIWKLSAELKADVPGVHVHVLMTYDDMM